MNVEDSTKQRRGVREENYVVKLQRPAHQPDDVLLTSFIFTVRLLLLKYNKFYFYLSLLSVTPHKTLLIFISAKQLLKILCNKSITYKIDIIIILRKLLIK